MADAKINPEYAQGKMVTVGTFWNRVEAEAVQAMLQLEGVPSVVSGEQSTSPMEIQLLVPSSGSGKASELLAEL